MYRKRFLIITKILIFFAGIVLTLDGVRVLFSLIDTKNYIHTVGVVEVAKMLSYYILLSIKKNFIFFNNNFRHEQQFVKVPIL